jgi:hypothetical protein
MVQLLLVVPLLLHSATTIVQLAGHSATRDTVTPSQSQGYTQHCITKEYFYERLRALFSLPFPLKAPTCAEDCKKVEINVVKKMEFFKKKKKSGTSTNVTCDMSLYTDKPTTSGVFTEKATTCDYSVARDEASDMSASTDEPTTSGAFTEKATTRDYSVARDEASDMSASTDKPTTSGAFTEKATTSDVSLRHVPNNEDESLRVRHDMMDALLKSNLFV